MDELARLREALARVEEELRARMGGGRPKQRKKKPRMRPGRPARTGKKTGCGTGAGGFGEGNDCAKEDGIPNKPYALKMPNVKQLKKEVAQEKGAAAAAAAKKKQLEISQKKKAALVRKEAKAKKSAEEKQKAAEAAAAKKKAMLQKIRVKKANEKVSVVGTPKSVAEQLAEAKAAMKQKTAEASKQLTVTGTPKSVKEQIEEIKAAEAKAKAVAEAKKIAEAEAAAKQKAIAEAMAKTAAIQKPAPALRVDKTPVDEMLSPATTPKPQDLKVTKALGGSTGAVLAQDSAGNKFVVKSGKHKAHIESESEADALYRAAGVAVPKQQLHADSDGTVKKVAEFVDGKTLADLKATDTKKYEAAVAKLKKDFVVDALLGNRDVIGMNMDNIVVAKNGKVYRVDNGGALFYRAQGALKSPTAGDPAGFGPVAHEIDTLRNPSMNASAAAVFGGMSNKEISSQITKVLKNKEIILAAAKTEQMRSVLKQRFESLKAWQKKQAAEAKAAGKPAPTKKASSPEDLTASVPEGIPKTTGKGWTWEKRKALGSKLWSFMTGAEQNAVTKWGGSSGWIKDQDAKHGAVAQTAGTNEYRHFVAAVAKMPQFVGGTVYRGMKNITESQVNSWLKSGRFSHSFEGNSNTTHASMTTSRAKGLEFSKGQQGRVLVKISNPKRAKDTAGTIFAHQKEQEVIALPGAEYKVKKAYFIVRKEGGFLGYKNGAKVSETEWMTKIDGYYKGALKSGYSMHNDARLVRVIEVEEI